MPPPPHASHATQHESSMAAVHLADVRCTARLTGFGNAVPVKRVLLQAGPCLRQQLLLQLDLRSTQSSEVSLVGRQTSCRLCCEAEVMHHHAYPCLCQQLLLQLDLRGTQFSEVSLVGRQTSCRLCCEAEVMHHHAYPRLRQQLLLQLDLRGTQFSEGSLGCQAIITMGVCCEASCVCTFVCAAQIANLFTAEGLWSVKVQKPSSCMCMDSCPPVFQGLGAFQQYSRLDQDCTNAWA